MINPEGQWQGKTVMKMKAADEPDRKVNPFTFRHTHYLYSCTFFFILVLFVWSPDVALQCSQV